MGQCVSQQTAFNTGLESNNELTNSEPAIADSASATDNFIRETESLPAEEVRLSGKRARRKSSIASLVPKVRETFHRRKSGRNNNLSATFNMAGTDFKVAALDINVATEEELMTLPGITRTLAHKIIDHRSAIGGFKKIEDLALVSGIGAVKLQLIKPEICIDRKLSSRSSSVTTTEASFNSINGEVIANANLSPRLETRNRKRDIININTATIFQLMTVEGVSQELAAHIVHYRERKGPFKTVYDLRKVHGFNSRLISALSPYLSTYDYDKPNSFTGHRRTASLPVSPGFTFPTFENGKVCDFPTSSEFAEALKISQNGVHPEIEEVETEEDNEDSEDQLIRILCWNLDNLTVDKARNPGVIEVVLTILKQQTIGFAVIQGLGEENALEELCRGINQRLVKEKPAIQFQSFSHVDSGFLFKQKIAVSASKSIDAANVPVTISHCCFGGKELTVANMTVSETSQICAAKIVQDILNHSDNERILIAADLSNRDHAKVVEEFQELGYRPLVDKSVSTALEATKTDQSVHCNVLVSRYAQQGLNGKSGVITEGLTHLLIPVGWSWNGPASTKCPLWFEFDISQLE